MKNAESTTSPVAISFNSAAVAAFDDKAPTGTRFRVKELDGKLFIKPTWRVQGPHVFSDYARSTSETRQGIKIVLEGHQLDKLGIQLEPGSKYAVAEHKYGWFFLTDEGAEDVVAGAKASITKRPGGSTKATPTATAAVEDSAASAPEGSSADRAAEATAE